MDVLVHQRRSDKHFLVGVREGGAEWSPSLMDAGFVRYDAVALCAQRSWSRQLGTRLVRVRMDVIGAKA